MFFRLQLELQSMAQEYGVSDEEINEYFVQVSCSKTKLIELLKGENFTRWTELEDLALRKEETSVEFKYLLKSKGMDEIKRRKKFLSI